MEGQSLCASVRRAIRWHHVVISLYSELESPISKIPRCTQTTEPTLHCSYLFTFCCAFHITVVVPSRMNLPSSDQLSSSTPFWFTSLGVQSNRKRPRVSHVLWVQDEPGTVWGNYKLPGYYCHHMREKKSQLITLSIASDLSYIDFKACKFRVPNAKCIVR